MRHIRENRRPLFLLMGVIAALLTAAGCKQSQPVSRYRSSGASRAPASAVYCPPATYGDAMCYEVTPAPAWQTVVGKTVILDPGHGGNDEGTAHFGLREKDINLELALRTASLLRARGANVVLTRNADVFILLPERSAIANRHPNATFVSIHVNASSSNPNAAGVETFVLSKEFSDADRSQAAVAKFNTGGDSVQAKQALANLTVKSRSRGPALASALQRSLTSRLGEIDRGVKPGNLAVLRETYFGPAVLVEVGFLTHARTAERMRGEEWRRRTAEALCEGICEFLQKPE